MACRRVKFKQYTVDEGVKRIVCYTKVRYRSIENNPPWLMTAFVLEKVRPTYGNSPFLIAFATAVPLWA